MTQDELLGKLDKLAKDWLDRKVSCIVLACNTPSELSMASVDHLRRIGGIWSRCANEIESLISEAKADDG